MGKQRKHPIRVVAPFGGRFSMVNPTSTDGEKQPDDSTQPVAAALVTEIASGPALASPQPRPAANPNSLSLGSLFTLTTLAALVVTVFCYHPYLLCLLIPLSLPATARAVYLRDMRVHGGEIPTLTNMSLDWGASLFVSAIAITSAVTALFQIAVPLVGIGWVNAVPVTVMSSLAGMVVVGNLGISKIWLVDAPGGKISSWSQRIENGLRGILQLIWMQGLPTFAIGLIPEAKTWPAAQEWQTVGCYAATIVVIFASGAIGYWFSNRLPLAATVTAIAFVAGVLVDWRTWPTLVGLLIGLVIEWKIGIRKTVKN